MSGVLGWIRLIMACRLDDSTIRNGRLFSTIWIASSLLSSFDVIGTQLWASVNGVDGVISLVIDVASLGAISDEVVALIACNSRQIWWCLVFICFQLLDDWEYRFAGAELLHWQWLQRNVTLRLGPIGDSVRAICSYSILLSRGNSVILFQSVVRGILDPNSGRVEYETRPIGFSLKKLKLILLDL